MTSSFPRLLQGIAPALLASVSVAQDIVPAPAFSAAELLAPPMRNRVTNDNACNQTRTAAYDGGWVHSPGARVPGPSASFPPDAPPSFAFEMFPRVYPLSFHYANPVSDRQ